jgi:hypothetical protein
MSNIYEVDHDNAEISDHDIRSLDLNLLRIFDADGSAQRTDADLQLAKTMSGPENS